MASMSPPENVLQAHHIIRSEAVTLERKLQMYRPMLAVGLCGSDPVSYAARDAFNAKIRGMVEGFDTYIATLHGTADQLELTAKSFGHTEDEINRSFDAHQKARDFIGRKVPEPRT